MKNYNLDLLKEQCGDDQNFFNEMLDIFVKSTMEGITGMEEAYAKNDMKMLGHYAHKIVSPCRHIDAQKLIPLLKEMETQAEKNELGPEHASFLIRKIKQEAGELVKELKTEYIK